MTTTPLSPTTQKVLDAAYACMDKNPRNEVDATIAAALRAAADQVVPEDGDPIYGLTPTQSDRQVVRRKFLAIAAELEQEAPINTTETTP
jgi:hypothetical protein